MKLIMILIGVLLLFTASAFGELTQTDIEKIRLTVGESEKRIKEYVKTEIDELDARLNGEIKALDARLSGEIKALDAHLSGEIQASGARLSGEIQASGAHFSKEIEGLDKRLDHIFALVMVLIVFIAVVVGVPQILVSMQRKNERTQDEKIEAQQKQIEAQQKQIEALQHEMAARKHERIATP